MKDYYYILGINKNASNNEIKAAYRKLSKKFILMLTMEINFLKKDLSKFKKHMKF